MTREELAAKFCDSCAELQKAEFKRKVCEERRSESDTERTRRRVALDTLVRTGITRPKLTNSPTNGAAAKAASDAAIAFAQSVAGWRAAEVAFATAEATVEALTKEVNEGLEALITACQPAE